MIILTDEQASAALEEVGQLQRAVDGRQVDLDSAIDMIVERADAVAALYADSTTVYSAFIEPLTLWGVHTLGPKFIVDQDSTPESHLYKSNFAKVSAFHDRWKHLDPEGDES